MTPLPQTLSEVQGALQSTHHSVVWHPINSAAHVSVSLRMSISHASHAELLVVPNCIMFSLTHGLSFYHNRYPCCPFCLLFLHLDVSPGPFLSLSGHHQFLPSLSAYAVPLFKRWSLLMPLLWLLWNRNDVLRLLSPNLKNPGSCHLLPLRKPADTQVPPLKMAMWGIPS